MALVVKQRRLSDVVVLDLTGRLWILDLPLRDLMNVLLSDGKRQFVLNLAPWITWTVPVWVSLSRFGAPFGAETAI
jgi:hypothetical protein